MFEDIYGNEQVKNSLSGDIAANALTHAYIIEGPAGSGRHTLLRGILTALAGEDFRHKITQDITPDVISIAVPKDKKSIGVDDVRAVKEEAYLSPNELEFKAFVINEAALMTVQAQNALLKLLEEPPDNVYFFLICENAAALLPTVRSRAPVLRMQVFGGGELDRYLAENVKKARELKQKDRVSYDFALKMSGGSIGGALSAMEKRRSAHDGAISAQSLDFVTSALTENDAALFSRIATLSVKRDELSEFIASCELAVRDIVAVKCGGENAPLLFFGSRDDAERLSDAAGLSRLISLYDILERTRVELWRNINVNTAQAALLSRISAARR
ncbi:MAG: hypothetical protein WCQ72_01465 [Eubacteriales bacterium]